MTVVAVTKQSEIVGYPMSFATGNVAATGDCITFAESGVIPFFFTLQNNTTGDATCSAQWNYAKCVVTTTYDTAATSIVYDGGTANERLATNYYARNGRTGEVIFVKSDSGVTTTTGTLVVVRGCLGTTAAAMADSDNLYVQNSIVSTSALVGTAVIGYFALPELHKATFF